MKNKFYADSLKIVAVISAVEGIVAGILTYLIPGEIGNGLFGGLSTQRWILLIGIAVVSLVFFLLSANFHFSKTIRSSIGLLVGRFFGPLGFVTLFLLFSLFFPPIELIKNYSAQFQRLFYFAFWIGLIGFQFWAWFLISCIQEQGWSNYSRNLLVKIKPSLPWIISFIFPFIFMTPRLWIFGEHHYSVGNDFVPFSYYYKIYLLDYLAHFRLPLWSPSEAAGFPYLASPQTGALYPINIPLALIYWWKGTYGLIDHTWATVLGISIYSVGMFAWLREFRWKESNALLASLIVSVSFQLTEIIRFTKAVESIAWVPWMLFFFTRILKDPSRKQSTPFYFGFAFSVFAFITAGYLYYQYYSIFLLVPLIIFLLINSARRKIEFPNLHIRFIDLFRPVLALIGPFIILIPYFLNMYVLLEQAYRRGTRDYFYSTEHSFSWIDHLGSLVYPPISSPEGWYYFGILPLALLIYFFITKPQKTKNNNLSELWFLSFGVKLFIGFMLLLIISISFGKEFFFFNALWNYFPYFYAFRYWGRFTIMLIPVVGFILAASIETIRNRLESQANEKSSIQFLKILSKLGLIFLIIVMMSLYAHTFPVFPQWNTSFDLLTSRLWVFQASLVVSILFVTVLLILLKVDKLSPKLLKILPLIFLTITMLDLWPIGAFQWPLDIIPESHPPGRLNISEEIIPKSFNYPRTVGRTNISITPKFSVGPSPDWFFDSYVNFYHAHAFEDESRDIFLGRDKSARKLYLTDHIDYATTKEFLQDTDNFYGTYEVINYDGEYLEVKVESKKSGYLSFIDNWDPFWTVSVDGQPAELDKLFNTFKSVKIPSGESIVRFEYKPQLFPIDQLNTLTKK